jgi:hypothetical protein
MKGDFTGLSFKKEKHYRRVNMQQGRVQLDADWNEQISIDVHHERTFLNDIIGRTGTPIDSETKYSDGFKIVPPSASQKMYTISKGRYYVDGILCENEENITVDKQPDLPLDATGSNDAFLKDGPGPYIIYLDAWERHITYLDDPQIREIALLGPDTATRTKTVWQVKALKVDEITNPFTIAVVNPPSFPCLSTSPFWDSLINSSSGTLAARATPPGIETACDLPPKAGYTKLENHLYRIEIHDGGELGSTAAIPTPTFKWSADNGIVASNITEIDEQNHRLTVNNIGRDKNLSFTQPCWVEITSKKHELWGKQGTFVKIISVDQNTLTFDAMSKRPTDDDITNSNFPTQLNPKVRKWDCDPEQPAPCVVQIPSNNDGYLKLGDDGVEIMFTPNGTYRTGDWWIIPARTATKDIEWPIDDSTQKPRSLLPFGIKHHFARLAILTYKGESIDPKSLTDCRSTFPSLTDTKPSGTCCATSGRLNLTGLPTSNNSFTPHLFGPFNHFLNGFVPPAIILGYYPKAGDAGDIFSAFASNANSVNMGQPVFPKSTWYLKAVNVNEQNFMIAIGADAATFKHLNGLLSLRWWAIPAQSEPAEQEGAERQIKISPSSESVDSTVTVTGSSFYPSSNITLKFDQKTLTTSPAPIISDKSGLFNGVTFTVPSSTAGLHNITATDSFADATTQFTITPKISLTVSPKTPIGPFTAIEVQFNVNVVGSGFAGNSVIQLLLDNKTPIKIQPNLKTKETGEFKATFTVARSSIGQSLTATDSKNNSVSALLTVIT